MENFTPYSALAGGVLIGLSATILLLFNGRITGISGMISNVLPPVQEDWRWRLLFLLGIIAGTGLYLLLFAENYNPRSQFPIGLLISGGFLVGFGTRLGSGCTSGHAICGFARLSPRSIVATLIFMFFGGATVFIIRHLLGMGS